AFCRSLRLRLDLRRALRTLRLVGHILRNSASSRGGSLLQIFAEKHPPGQVRPSPPPQLPPPAPRTNPTAHTPPESAPSGPCPPFPAACARSKSVSDPRAPQDLLRS